MSINWPSILVRIIYLFNLLFLLSTISLDVRQESRHKLESAWQNYCETGGDELDTTAGGTPMKPAPRPVRMTSIEDDDVLPLPEGALTVNLGLDLVVVVTKVGKVKKKKTN